MVHNSMLNRDGKALLVGSKKLQGVLAREGAERRTHHLVALVLRLPIAKQTYHAIHGAPKVCQNFPAKMDGSINGSIRIKGRSRCHMQTS